ncbi:MAG: hypothetical protein OEQ74_01165 [Gammaproteobacteria bacterium]|nr:hypothetical protein [Gammaproteobacteria bacterium]
MRMPRNSIGLIALLILIGCVPVRYVTVAPADESRVRIKTNVPDLPQRIGELSAALQALDPSVEPAEALRLAKTAVHYPLQLADHYKLTKPPLIHNMLVNAGLRPRGLCIHWTEDLLGRLHELRLESFDLWWGVATPATRFHVEHSTVVATARGQPFEDGIILDGWRDSGWLYWSPVADDKYTWNIMGNYISGMGL